MDPELRAIPPHLRPVIVILWSYASFRIFSVKSNIALKAGRRIADPEEITEGMLKEMLGKPSSSPACEKHHPERFPVVRSSG